jgi:hypothetical protein
MVSGVDRSSPTGPQSNVQKAAATPKHRDAGKPRAAAVEPGLVHLTGDALGNNAQTDDPERLI